MPKDILFEGKFDIAANNWWEFAIELEKGDILHFVARENYGDDFDFYILPEEDATDDNFWTEHAFFEDEYESSYRGKYKCKESGTYKVIISNHRARSVIREIYAKIQVEISQKAGGQVGSIGRASNNESFTQFIKSWSIPLSLIIITAILSTIFFFIIPGIASTITFVGGSIFTLYLVYRQESKNKQ